MEIPGGAGGLIPHLPCFAGPNPVEELGQDKCPFSHPLALASLPMNSLHLSSPAQSQGASHSKKHLGEEGREMLGGGTRQADGMIRPPSPGPEHAECPWMQKAGTPMSSLNETHSAFLGFK